MRITELLDKRSICLDATPVSKQETLDLAVDLMVKSGKIKDAEVYRQAVYAREEEGTTGIGEGIAIPHGRGDSVLKAGLAAMVIKNGVDFDSLDEEPVYLLFLIAAPNTKDNIHLDVLSKLSTLLMDEQFVLDLKDAKTSEEFLSIVDKADEEKLSIDEKLEAQSVEGNFACKILAVTGCPTGIAHTYMAAVMIGGMVLPCAIPYAAADPTRVIPACVVGSALSGALSMAFGCTLMAPHGGIFVFPVVGNGWLYLVALAVGTIVGAVLLGALKKKVIE